MKEINAEHIKVLLEFLGGCNYFGLLGLKVCEIKSGYCRVEISLSEKHQNPFGGIHGGVYASLIDCAAFWSVYCDLDEESGLVTLDLKVDYLAAIKGGKAVVEGKRIKTGRTVCLSEAIVTDGEGKLLAHGTSKQLVTQGLQSIKRSAAERGVILPSKFSLS